MNSPNYNDAHIQLIEKYYDAIVQKDFDAASSYLSENVLYINPLAELQGREAVISSAKKLSAGLESITIRSTFSSNNQVMLACDFYCNAPIGKVRAAVLVDFSNNLINRMELFFDSQLFR